MPFLFFAAVFVLLGWLACECDVFATVPAAGPQTATSSAPSSPAPVDPVAQLPRRERRAHARALSRSRSPPPLPAWARPGSLLCPPRQSFRHIPAERHDTFLDVEQTEAFGQMKRVFDPILGWKWVAVRGAELVSVPSLSTPASAPAPPPVPSPPSVASPPSPPTPSPPTPSPPTPPTPAPPAPVVVSPPSPSVADLLAGIPSLPQGMTQIFPMEAPAPPLQFPFGLSLAAPISAPSSLAMVLPSFPPPVPFLPVAEAAGQSQSDPISSFAAPPPPPPLPSASFSSAPIPPFTSFSFGDGSGPGAGAGSGTAASFGSGFAAPPPPPPSSSFPSAPLPPPSFTPLSFGDGSGPGAGAGSGPTASFGSGFAASIPPPPSGGFGGFEAINFTLPPSSSSAPASRRTRGGKKVVKPRVVDDTKVDTFSGPSIPLSEAAAFKRTLKIHPIKTIGLVNKAHIMSARYQDVCMDGLADMTGYVPGSTFASFEQMFRTKEIGLRLFALLIRWQLDTGLPQPAGGSVALNQLIAMLACVDGLVAGCVAEKGRAAFERGKFGEWARSWHFLVLHLCGDRGEELLRQLDPAVFGQLEDLVGRNQAHWARFRPSPEGRDLVE